MNIVQTIVKNTGVLGIARVISFPEFLTTLYKRL